jgi:hypothetical protein
MTKIESEDHEMSIEIFFTRPGEVCEIAERIKSDLKFAKHRILGATYFLTEDDYINLVKNSPVPLKKFVVNKEENKIRGITNVKIGLDNCKEFNILMHHKFLIIDDILWVGSYNLSKNATLNNWENIMRITEISVVNQYVSEFKKMYVWGKALRNSNFIGFKLFNKDLNECKYCKEELTCYKHKYIYCKECNKQISDPFEHFRVIFKTVEDKRENFREMDGEYYKTEEFIFEDSRRISNIVLECINKDESIEKLKCPICGTFHWKKNLSRIDLYRDVKLFYQSGTDLIFDEETNTALGTEPIFDFEKSEERFISSEEICLECLFDTIEERFDK